MIQISAFFGTQLNGSLSRKPSGKATNKKNQVTVFHAVVLCHPNISKNAE
jgi:hypothetical protein